MHGSLWALGMAATLALLWTASAGTEQAPELQDPAGDQRADPATPVVTNPLAPVEADFDQVWVAKEDAAGIHVALRLVCACNDGSDTAYTVGLRYNGTAIAPGAREGEPTGPASSVRVEAGRVTIVVPHGALPGPAVRGEALRIDNVTSVSRQGLVTAWDWNTPGVAGTYVLGALATPDAPLQAPSPPPVPPPTHAINLLRARDLGCSVDKNSPEDLQVTVLVNGTEVLWTYAADTNDPEFALVHPLHVPRPVLVEVRVREGEGSVNWFAEERYYDCDVTPGGQGTSLRFEWDGSARLVDTAGDGDLAARVVVRFGPAPPAAPVARATAGTSTAVLEWEPAAGAAYEVRGPGLRFPVPDGAASVEWTGLCDGTTHEPIHLVLLQDGWAIPSGGVTVVTQNTHPASPVLWSVTHQGSRHAVSFQEPTPGNMARYELVARDGSGAGRVVATEAHPANAVDQGIGTAFDPDTTAFQVVAWDDTGLFAASDWFEVGQAPRPKQDFKKPQCWPEFLPAPDSPAPAAALPTTSVPPPSADAPPSSREPAGGGLAPSAPETGIRAVQAGAGALLLVALVAGLQAKRRSRGRPPLEP